LSTKTKKRKKRKKSSGEDKRTPILGAIVTLIGSLYAIGAVFVFSVATVGIAIIMMFFTVDIALTLAAFTLIIPGFLYFGTLFVGFVALFKVAIARKLTLIFAIISLACIGFAVLVIVIFPASFGINVLFLALHPVISGSIVLVGGILVNVPI